MQIRSMKKYHYIVIKAAHLKRNPHPRIHFIGFRKRERRETDRNLSERNIHGLPPIHTPIGCGTLNLGMCPH